MRSQIRSGMAIGFLLILVVGEIPSSWGQNPPPPVAPNPQAPVLAMPMPLGMQRGTTLDLLLTGSNLAGPTGLWTGFPAKITIPSEDKNGQDNSKLKVRLEVGADVPLGYYALRLATTRGMSNLRLFCIDDLPPVPASESNHKFDTPQSLPIPCVVAGRAVAEAGAYFRITVKPGERVSFDVLGHRLGSPIDPQLSIYSANSKREIAHDNDAPGCQSDPRLTHVFKEAGAYIIELKDVLNRGGPDYVYRLRVGDFPVATVPIPMAAKRGSKVTVQFAGPQVAGALPVDVAVPSDPAVHVVWVAPQGPNGLHGWPVALAVSDLDEALEQEPNDQPVQANRITVPGGLTGRFQHSDDTDYYVFAAKKGQKLTIAAKTLELYSPTLVYMVLKKSDPPQPPLRKGGSKEKAPLRKGETTRLPPLTKGGIEGGWIEIAKTDPQRPPPADQRIEFTASQDGDYLLEVQHLTYAGGASEAYHLTIAPTVPGFDVSLDLDRYDLPPHSYVPLNLAVTRRGYTGPIEVSAIGTPHGVGSRVPELIGSVTLKEGQTTGTLLVISKVAAPPGPYDLRLIAKATIAGQTVMAPVSVKAPVSAGLSGLTYPPLQMNYQVAVAVKEKAPFTLALQMEPPQAVPGIPTQVTIKVVRAPGFVEAITLSPPAGLPANVPAPKLATIAKDKNELKFPLDVNAKAPLGEYLVFFSGQAKVKDKEFSARATPLTLLVGQPFDLNVEPKVVDLEAGGKGKVKISAHRQGGYKGPITVELRKLPANVTAGKGTIAADQTSLELEVTAAAVAMPGEKKDVDVNGTATALNNLQNASPVFTVRLVKAEEPRNYPPPSQVKAAPIDGSPPSPTINLLILQPTVGLEKTRSPGASRRWMQRLPRPTS